MVQIQVFIEILIGVSIKDIAEIRGGKAFIISVFKPFYIVKSGRCAGIRVVYIVKVYAALLFFFRLGSTS